MNAFSFPLRQHIWRNEDGIWMLFTGTATIPHETWRLAWDHAAFINRIRTEA
jgi:hypothetical protein